MQDTRGLPDADSKSKCFLFFAFFKTNTGQGRAIGMNDWLNIELRNDSSKMFDQAWAETSMARDTQRSFGFLGRSVLSTIVRVDHHEECPGSIPFGSTLPKKSRRKAMVNFLEHQQQEALRKIQCKKEEPGSGYPKPRVQEAQKCIQAR